MIAHNANGIVDKHGRNFYHIIPQLSVRLGNIGIFSRWRFQLYKHQRKPVDEQYDIRSFGAILNICPLVRNYKGVVLRLLIIDKAHDFRMLLAVFVISGCDAVLEIIHEHFILLSEFAYLYITQAKKGVLDGVF